MPAEVIVEHAVVTLAIHAIERFRRTRFLQYKVLRPNAEMRVSFSALLRITQASRFLLIRNLHRRESFGPLGGVFKFHREAQESLESIQFRQQNIGATEDMRNDLRGFIPRKKLLSMVNWFKGHEGRESATECLYRELQEELAEISVNDHVAFPPHLEFKKIRVVEDGPARVPGQTYVQFRIFEIYEPTPDSKLSFEFFDNLFRLGRDHPDLLLADTHEIITGRSADGRVIGNHSGYLIGKKKIRPDLPMFANSTR